MTPNADDPAGHWLSELPPDLLAQRIAAAYGMAGLLPPPGGKTREVYEVQTTGCRWPGLSEAEAWRHLADAKAWTEKPPVQLYRQTVTEWPDGRVHRGPLVEVYADRPTPTTEAP